MGRGREGLAYFWGLWIAQHISLKDAPEEQIIDIKEPSFNRRGGEEGERREERGRKEGRKVYMITIFSSNFYESLLLWLKTLFWLPI